MIIITCTYDTWQVKPFSAIRSHDLLGSHQLNTFILSSIRTTTIYISLFYVLMFSILHSLCTFIHEFLDLSIQLLSTKILERQEIIFLCLLISTKTGLISPLKPIRAPIDLPTHLFSLLTQLLLSQQLHFTKKKTVLLGTMSCWSTKSTDSFLMTCNCWNPFQTPCFIFKVLIVLQFEHI